MSHNETPQSTSDNHVEEQEIESFDSFDNMNLPTALLRGIYSYGFEKPSIIQQKAIVPIIKGRDIIAQAQSGTGKTATFTIGCLARLQQSKLLSQSERSCGPKLISVASDFSCGKLISRSESSLGTKLNENKPRQKSASPQVVIISPTRELSEQTYHVVTELSQKMSVNAVLCIGGTSVNSDIRSLQQGSDIVIGTPGRIYDLMSRRNMKTESIKMLVLDEADEMLSHGFKDQIYDIFMELPKDIQVILVSATLPVEVLDLTKKFMRDPIKILVKTDELTLEGIRQFHIKLDQEEWKLDTLQDLWNTLAMTQTIIYVNTKRKCQWLTHRLKEQGYAVSEIHSNLTPIERKEIMKSFKSGGTRILITTDLLARGIDVQQVALVVNYDLPQQIETYIHRIGRSGRFGRKGLAINLVNPHDYNKIQELCRFYSTEIPEMPNNINELI